MATMKIDAKVLKNLFLAGAANLEAKKEWINDLNVFPVPDGDTGTNMTLTIMSAAKEVNGLANPTMESLAKAISSGSLRGARGNSGVILSQLLRGFTKIIREHDEIDAEIAAEAFQKAVETAYKAVMKPKEGTILTVARGMADKIQELAGKEKDLEKLFDAVIKHGDVVLNKTPDMLPVLKQAGVVDSGGQGLMQVMKGAYDVLMGKEIDFEVVGGSGNVAKANADIAQGIEEVDIKFGYCTEFIVMLEKPYSAKKEADFKAYLESIGDSIVLVSDDEIIKVHVHTNHPGLAFEKGLTFGSLTRMKVDNMREEHQERLIANASKIANGEAEAPVAQEKAEEPVKEVPNKKYGFISVSAGEGLSEIFKSLGVDYVIEGGQTMNPSTEDMLNAIDKVCEWEGFSTWSQLASCFNIIVNEYDIGGKKESYGNLSHRTIINALKQFRTFVNRSQTTFANNSIAVKSNTESSAELSTDYFSTYDAYTDKDILWINQAGITLKSGVFIDFKVCSENYGTANSESNSICVGERDITDLSFTFYASPHPIMIKYIPSNKFVELFLPLNATNRFDNMRRTIITYGYTTYDLS